MRFWRRNKGKSKTSEPFKSIYSHSERINSIWSDGKGTLVLAASGKLLIRQQDAWRDVESATADGLWGSSVCTLLVTGDEGLHHFDGVEMFQLADSNCFLHSIWGTPEGEVFVGSDDGLLKLNGTVLDLFLDEQVYQIHGTSGQNLFLATGDGLLHFNGAEWTALDVTGKIFGVWAFGESAFAVGEKQIWYFDGQTLTRPDVPTTETLCAIHGISETAIVAVGDAGTVLLFDGFQWRKSDCPTSKNLLTCRVDSQQGVFVGSEHEVFHAARPGAE